MFRIWWIQFRWL